MKPRNTWMLVALAGAMFAFIFFFERHWGLPVTVDTRVLPEFSVADVTSVQIQPNGGMGIRADLTNGAWRLSEPIVCPAQTLTIEALLRALADLHYATRLSAQELRDQPKAAEEYGFDAPPFTILIQEGEARRQIKLGKITQPGDQLYLQVVGAEGVDVVGVSLLRLIPRQANDWRDTAFAHLKGVNFDRLEVTNGTKVVELRRGGLDQVWRTTYPAQARADNSKITELLFSLENLRISRFETDDPRADLDAMGLQPAAWSLTVGQGTNQVAAFLFGKSPTNDSGQVYARQDGQRGVVLIPRDQIEPWRMDFDDFRDRRLAGLTAVPLDVIDVRGPENFVLLRQTNESWRIIAPPHDWPADAALVRQFISDLGNLEITPYEGQFAVKGVVTDADLPNYGLASPVRRYLLSRTATNAAGGRTNVTVAELDFGLQKGDTIFARRGDRPEESSVYAIKAADYERLPTDSLSLRERRIWYFTPDQVARISVKNEGRVERVQRLANGAWQIEPGSQGLLRNISAIEAGTQNLGELTAARWVQCGAQNATNFGFSDKTIEFTVDVVAGGKVLTAALKLGGVSPAPRKLRYGLTRLDDQDWIFEIPSGVLEPLLYGLNLDAGLAQ